MLAEISYSNIVWLIYQSKMYNSIISRSKGGDTLDDCHLRQTIKYIPGIYYIFINETYYTAIGNFTALIKGAV